MWPSHLPPYHSYLRAPNLLLRAVDVCDALARVEGGGVLVSDVLDLNERGVGVGVPLACFTSNCHQ